MKIFRSFFVILAFSAFASIGSAQPLNLQALLDDMYQSNPPYSTEQVVFSNHWIMGKGETRVAYAVVVVKTSVDDCHACPARLDGALFRKDRYTDDKWQRSRFRRDFAITGGFNEPGEISLMRLSDGEYALRIDDGFTGQGYTVTNTTIYLLEMEFERIAAFRTGEDNSGACDPPRMRCFGFETKITTVPAQKEPESGFYDLKVVTTGTNSSFKPMNRTAFYRFNGIAYDRK